jgi:heptosyltransferase III
VSLFSPVVPAERWAPFGVPTVVLGDQHAACRDTRARECPVAGHPCLSSVAPSEVTAAVVALTAAEVEPRIDATTTPSPGPTVPGPRPALKEARP